MKNIYLILAIIFFNSCDEINSKKGIKNDPTVTEGSYEAEVRVEFPQVRLNELKNKIIYNCDEIAFDQLNSYFGRSLDFPLFFYCSYFMAYKCKHYKGFEGLSTIISMKRLEDSIGNENKYYLYKTFKGYHNNQDLLELFGDTIVDVNKFYRE